jgi:hypothetical protein
VLDDPGDGTGFEGIEGRNSVDYLLLDVQSELVARASQADFKASVLLTACSVVLTIAASQVREDHDLVWPVAVLSVFLLIAMVLAVLCVIPTLPKRTDPAPPKGRNPLFFANFVHWTEDQYVQILGHLSRSDAGVYDALARDIYHQGLHLTAAKYRHLRFGYLSFLIGFGAAAVAAAISFSI